MAVRRLASSFVTLWIGFFIPSFLLWGGMLRWSPSTANRFESIWNWTADRLAFPLLLAPLNTTAWQAVHDGSVLGAVSGFVYLTGLWALMLTLPLTIIAGWWAFLTRRRATPAALPAASDVKSLDLPSPPSAPDPSPLGVLHVVTVPLALLWLGAVGLFTLCHRAMARFLRFVRQPPESAVAFLTPILLLSALTFLIVTGLLAYAFPEMRYRDWSEARTLLVTDIWLGYLDNVYLPAPIEDRFYDYIWTMEQRHELSSRAAWGDYVSHWYRHPAPRNIVLMLAVRHALGMAMLVTAFQIVRRAFRR